MRITLRVVEAPTSHASVGSNLQTQLSPWTQASLLAATETDIYTIDIASGAATKLTYVKQHVSPILQIYAAQDRASFYIVQDKVYRFSYTGPELLGPELLGPELLTAYSTPQPSSMVEVGTSIWVFASSDLSQYDKLEESFIRSVPYPTGLTSVVAYSCTHTSHPDDLYVVGTSTTQAFGFRKFRLSTNSWSTISLTLPRITRCAFTTEGQFVFLTTTTATWVYSLTEATLTQVYTGQVTGLYLQQTYALLARQNQPIAKQPIIVEDARNCGPGKHSQSAGLTAESQCQPCPTGFLCPGGAALQPCTAGTYSDNDGLRVQQQCTVCPPGHFCTAGDAIQLCPLGSYSLAEGLRFASQCDTCPPNFYCPNTTVIFPCPDNTMSSAGSSDLGKCLCNAGYKCEVTKVIHAEVTLPITVQDFDAMRQQYILAVAAAAGVDPSQVIIVSVTPSSGPTRRRRLMSNKYYIEVHTSVYKTKDVQLKSLQLHLKRRGLPPHHDLNIEIHREVVSSEKL